MSTPCTYCDSPVERHDPVYVREREGPERAFCNYACLTSYIDDEGLTTGNCCEWSPA
jgi:hypothetical protein